MNALIKKSFVGLIGLFAAVNIYADLNMINNTTDTRLIFYVGLGTCNEQELSPGQSSNPPYSPDLACQIIPEVTSITFLDKQHNPYFLDFYIGNSSDPNRIIISGTYPNYQCTFDYGSCNDAMKRSA